MKRLFLLGSIVLLMPILKAQLVMDSIYTGFENANNFISISAGTNSWQIGTPNKTVFNSSFSPTNSLVTDTINTYPINDTSIFMAVYGPPVASYLGAYFPFEINFYHRFNTDTLTDAGKMEISFDGGISWINGLTDEYASYYYPHFNQHYFENDGSTYYDSLNVSGNSNGWVHSIIGKDVYGWGVVNWSVNIDSIMVKFTFVSDGVDNFKDGWQIDDLCLKYYETLMSLEENESAIGMHISPNPFATQTIIHTNVELSNACLTIYNQFGQRVKTVDPIFGQSISLLRDNLRSGLYYIQLSQQNKIISTKKLFVID
jgi:hypothetical protein